MLSSETTESCVYLRDLRSILAEAASGETIERMPLLRQLWVLHARAVMAEAGELSLGAIASVITICTTLPAPRPPREIAA